jgi:hypothetical protein
VDIGCGVEVCHGETLSTTSDKSAPKRFRGNVVCGQLRSFGVSAETSSLDNRSLVGASRSPVEITRLAMQPPATLAGHSLNNRTT